MAEAGNRYSLTKRRRGWPRIWGARLGATLSLLLLLFFGYRGLRTLGFEFRWESDNGPSTTSIPGAGRATRQVETVDDSHAPLVANAGPEPLAADSGAGTDANNTGAGPSNAGRSQPASPAAARIQSTVLEPPRPRPAPSRSREAQAAVSLDFESFGNGRQFCAPCAVSTEWEGQGLEVSFRSWTSDSTTPTILDGRDYLPPEADQHALAPAFRSDRGLEVGVIRLDFLRRPSVVSFTLYGPDIISHFEVTAWQGDRILAGAIERTGGRTYEVSGRGLFREERVTVRGDAGIDRISLDGWGPPGHMLLVDDLVITP